MNQRRNNPDPKWQDHLPDPHLIKEISIKHQISPLISSLLVNRNLVHDEDIQLYLKGSLKDLPNPFLLRNLELAVDRVITAICHQEKIYIYGDYDVDGTVATAIFKLFFEQINYPLFYYIPHRIEEGYSLNKNALDKINRDQGKVVITVDNGTSAIDQVEYANSLGIDIIITDHHQISDQLPQAYALVNPHQKDCSYPDKGICGAGVAFNFLMGLRQKLREKDFFKEIPEPDLRNFLDLVALATVCDVMPLVGVNRIFVKYGLKQMQNTKWLGLKVLMEISAVHDEVSVYDLGFKLGPRLNALGRLSKAVHGVDLLTSSNYQICQELAIKAHKINDQRREIEDHILTEILELIHHLPFSKMGYVFCNPHWHLGVIGIVASRVVEKLCRPVILLCKNDQYYKGSGRSYGPVNIVQALDDCQHLLESYGGHKQACGLTIKEENIDQFIEKFDQAVSLQVNPDDCIPKIKIDGYLKIDDCSLDLVDSIENLAPFGMGNPEPVFALKEPKYKNLKVLKEKHLKFELEANEKISAIGFDKILDQIKLESSFDLAVNLRKNNFFSKPEISLHIKDIKST